MSPRRATSASDRHVRDTALALRIREGDAEAFATAFRAYYATLVHFVRRYVQTVGDAEDIAQEIMVQLWERRAAIDPERSLRAFLFTSARHRALDAHRRRQVITRHMAEVQVEPTETPSADAQLLADELHQVAAVCIANLAPRQREIFQLSRDEGLSPAEIGDVLGIATQTVYVQLSRVTKALYQALDGWIQDR